MITDHAPLIDMGFLTKLQKMHTRSGRYMCSCFEPQILPFLFSIVAIFLTLKIISKV